MISNINYRGFIVDTVDHLPFRQNPPYMYTHNCVDSNSHGKCKLLIFPSGKCRIMGCKKPLLLLHGEIDSSSSNTLDVSPFRVKNVCIMSATVTFTMDRPLNLMKLGQFCYENRHKYMYEPEIFPALRLAQFNPLCVNVFASGKCVILGIRQLCYANIIHRVKHFINTSGALDTCHHHHHRHHASETRQQQ